MCSRKCMSAVCAILTGSSDSPLCHTMGCQSKVELVLNSATSQDYLKFMCQDNNIRKIILAQYQSIYASVEMVISDGQKYLIVFFYFSAWLTASCQTWRYKFPFAGLELGRGVGCSSRCWVLMLTIENCIKSNFTFGNTVLTQGLH